MNELIFKGE